MASVTTPVAGSRPRPRGAPAPPRSARARSSVLRCRRRPRDRRPRIRSQVVRAHRQLGAVAFDQRTRGHQHGLQIQRGPKRRLSLPDVSVLGHAARADLPLGGAVGHLDLDGRPALLIGDDGRDPTTELGEVPAGLVEALSDSGQGSAGSPHEEVPAAGARHDVAGSVVAALAAELAEVVGGEGLLARHVAGDLLARGKAQGLHRLLHLRGLAVGTRDSAPKKATVVVQRPLGILLGFGHQLQRVLAPLLGDQVRAHHARRATVRTMCSSRRCGTPSRDAPRRRTRRSAGWASGWMLSSARSTSDSATSVRQRCALGVARLDRHLDHVARARHLVCYLDAQVEISRDHEVALRLVQGRAIDHRQRHAEVRGVLGGQDQLVLRTCPSGNTAVS